MAAPIRAPVAGQRWAPLAAAAALASFALLLVARDPNDAGTYPPCPTRLLTGLDCPGCGSLRAVHALLHADPARAAGHNVLLLLALPLAVFHFALWALPALQERDRLADWRSRVAGPWIRWGALTVVVLFTLARNVGSGPLSALHS